MGPRLEDFIYKEKLIPEGLCVRIMDAFPDFSWSPHTWYNKQTSKNRSYDTKELEVANGTTELHDQLAPFVTKALDEYQAKLEQKIINKINPIRFNRYPTGSMMRRHFDHIHDIFDGKDRGIPILSIVGALNDNYEGGEFCLGPHTFKIEQGDILLFPSSFVYPHHVNEIKKGTRCTFVSWAY